MKFRFLIPILWTATLFAQQISAPSTNGGVTADISDRAARLMGHVTVDTAPTTAVTGTFWQGTQPVSGTFWQATQPVSGTFWQATQPVSGTFWQATQPVSGTVSATQGTSPWVDDPADRAGRQLGVIANTSFIASNVPTSTTPNPQAADNAVVTRNIPSGIQTVTIVSTPPPLTQQQMSNPLLYRAAMANYCKTNLCPGVVK